MKKLAITLSLIAAVIFAGCSKDDTTATTTTLDPVQKEIVYAILEASFGGISGDPSAAPASLIKEKSASTDTYPFNYTYTNPLGGSIVMTGTYSMTSTTTSSTMAMAFTEVFKNNVLQVESGTKYTTNGTITYGGKYVMANDQSFAAESTIAGTLAVTGTNYNQNISIALKITQSYNGKTSKVTMTGTMAGAAVNYSEEYTGQ